MTKEEALEILKNSKLAKPSVEDGITYYSHIGEYIRENDDSFVFTVYPYTSIEPIKPTYAFATFVLKETGEVTGASAPIDEDGLKWTQENCEKINISVT